MAERIERPGKTALVPMRRVLTYRDAEGVERKMEDPDWWVIDHDGLQAMGRTKELCVGMYERMLSRRISRGAGDQ